MNRESWLAYHLAGSYIEESTCVSQPMSGYEHRRLDVAGLKLARCLLPRRQPLGFGFVVSQTTDGVAATA